MSLTFRPAVAADVEQIYRMLVALADHDHGQVKGGTESIARYGFGPEPMFRVILAEQDTVPVGLCLFVPEYSSWRGQIGVYVQDLYVAESARGLGLGRALLAEAARSGRDWEAQFLTLMVQRNNEIGLGFYNAQGFELRGDSRWVVLEGDALARLIAGTGQDDQEPVNTSLPASGVLP